MISPLIERPPSFANFQAMDRPPRICFVIHHHPETKIGGVELETQRLTKRLVADYGWECHYVSRTMNGWPYREMENGVYLHGVPFGGRDTAFIKYPAMARVLKDIDADIYYQRIALSHTAMVGYFAKRHKKPFVWATAHIEDCRPGKFKEFRKSVMQARGKSALRRQLAMMSAWVNDKAYPWGARQADLIITQTKNHQALLHRSFGVDSIVIYNINNFPDEFPERRTPPMVLWIANLARFKKAERFITLAESCQDLPCRFVMAGHPLDASYLAELQPQIEDLPNLSYLGGIEPQTAERLMGEATLFVNTSEAEGVPNTFIESWLRGTPVISLHVDPDEILAQEKLGAISGSMERLERDVRHLLNNPSDWEGASRRASQFARQNYHIDEITRQYHEAFSELLSR